MPLHDWSRVPSGLFHDFHQSWSIRLKDALNAGRLPPGVSALVEQRAGTIEADVLAVESRSRSLETSGNVATMPDPITTFVRRTSSEFYADKANRIVIQHRLGRTIAVIEIISPGNKHSRSALRDFVEKTSAYLKRGIHVLVIDVFPPSPRDPHGIHKAIWDEFVEEPFEIPEGKDRILASYRSGREKVAYIEPIGVNGLLPDMPLFLTRELNVMVPLEPTYQATWDAQPPAFKEAVETGVMPNPDVEE